MYFYVIASLSCTVLQTAAFKMDTGKIKQHVNPLSLVLSCLLGCQLNIFVIKLLFSPE